MTTTLVVAPAGAAVRVQWHPQKSAEIDDCSSDARDQRQLRNLADDDGAKLDEEINRLVRAERQRRMGQALSVVQLDEEDRSWLEVGAEVVRDDARR